MSDTRRNPPIDVAAIDLRTGCWTPVWFDRLQYINSLQPLSDIVFPSDDTKSDVLRAINEQTGTSYTFVLADNGKYCRFTNSGAVTVTVPPNSSVALPVGTQIDVIQGGAVTSTGLVKLGSTSLFKPQNGYIVTPDSTDFALGSADFTVDFWFNANSNASTQIPIFGQLDSGGGAADGSIYGVRSSAGVMGLGVSTGSSYFGAAATGIDTRDSNWRHFALVRTGNVLTLYVNGSSVFSGAFSASVPNSPGSFAVGKTGDFSFTDQASAYLDEFRLSVGVARWTSNFTPPDAPYI